MEEIKKRRVFTREFKENAVKLVMEGNRSVREVSKGLGINENLIYRWKKQFSEDRENSFPGKGHLKPYDEEIRRLRKELSDAREERDILKKAVGIFSRMHQ